MIIWGRHWSVGPQWASNSGVVLGRHLAARQDPKFDQNRARHEQIGRQTAVFSILLPASVVFLAFFRQYLFKFQPPTLENRILATAGERSWQNHDFEQPSILSARRPGVKKYRFLIKIILKRIDFERRSGREWKYIDFWPESFRNYRFRAPGPVGVSG